MPDDKLPPGWGFLKDYDYRLGSFARHDAGLPTREEMEAAAKRFIDSDLHRGKTVLEQSMDWAREMSSQVAREKEKAVVEALIVVMLASGAKSVRVQPQHVCEARDYALFRYVEPDTGDFVFNLVPKGA